MSQLEPRTFESDTHSYEITHSIPGRYDRDEVTGHERVLIRITAKKTGNAWVGAMPLNDAPIVGDLIASVGLERSGFERKEVRPDELQEDDVIEGVGPILEIEEIPGMTFDMLKVMVQMIPKPGGVTRGIASLLFSQENGEWPSLVGITRPINLDIDESP